MQAIQMHLSEKPKTFVVFLCAFFKSKSNFEHFQKKMTLIDYVFSKLRTPKNVVSLMSKKSRLRWPIDKQPGKPAETRIQSQWQLLYHIPWSMWR